METLEVGNPAVHAASNQSDVTQLLEQVHAKPPHRAVDVERVGEVGPAVAFEDLAVPLVHQRKREADHFFVFDWTAVHRPELPVDADHRRFAHLEVQVAGFELHAGTKQLVDLEVDVATDEAAFEGVVFGHGWEVVSS